MCGVRTLNRQWRYARYLVSTREPISPDLDPAALVPVVVGAHLRAELGDRETATTLATALDLVLSRVALGIRSCVLTDVWYLNDTRFRDRPAISVGHPEVNALSAHLADKLPSVLSQESVYVIQLDLEFESLNAACWGNEHETTAAACALFERRHLDQFARAIASRSLANAER